MKLLGLLFLVVVAVAVIVWMARRRAPAKLYPYVVPDAYFEQGASRQVARPLGHGLSVTLVFDRDGLVEGVTPEDLRRLGISVEHAHVVALTNLDELARAKRIELATFKGPQGRRFVLAGGSWAAATAILLPRLRDVAGEQVGSREICASIPHRDAMLLFAKADRAYRDEMRALVREQESDGRKPLTFELFELTDDGPAALVER